MSEMTASEINADETFARTPYSYGPFKIEAWLSGERIVLVRNEHYWRKGEGLPFLHHLPVGVNLLYR
jgi:ABC-type oligopeptide transport system substrate-binding subunit